MFERRPELFAGGAKFQNIGSHFSKATGLLTKLDFLVDVLLCEAPVHIILLLILHWLFLILVYLVIIFNIFGEIFHKGNHEPMNAEKVGVLHLNHFLQYLKQI